LQDVREARFAKGIQCPRCESSAVKRNGNFRDKKGYVKQRYLCKQCGKTFNDLTGTPLSYSKKQDLWGKMASCMVEGLSVRMAASRLRINKTTSFRWRNKLLGIRQHFAQPMLVGVIEADETYFKASFKGLRSLRERLGRLPRKRGERASKRGLSREQVCVLTARDRQAQSIYAVTGNGQPTTAKVRDVLEPGFRAGSVLCTDGAFPYRRFCQDTGVEHRAIDGKKRLKGSIYHINNINGYHNRRLKMWMVRFKGVATKYLPNYLAWHQYVDATGKMSLMASAKQMLIETCSFLPHVQAAWQCGTERRSLPSEK
jgi:transposase-like protein